MAYRATRPSARLRRRVGRWIASKATPSSSLTVAGSSQTQSADAIALTQHNVLGGLASSSQTQRAGVVWLFYGRYPASISGRKLLDQYGTQYLMHTFQSWTMPANLSNANITTALTSVAASSFNAVTVDCASALDLSVQGYTGWHQYQNQAGSNFWTGTPWASSFGSAWASTDFVVTECHRLGLVCNLSFHGGYDNIAARADWEAVTNTDMYNVGVAIATRYAAYPHILWQLEWDWTTTPTDTAGVRAEALFQGINDAEGASLRPFRWTEPNLTASTNSQGWLNTTQAKIPTNSLYSYNGTSTDDFDTVYGQATVPVGDCEPPYDGGGRYSTGNAAQQMRERTLAVFIRGGVWMAWGHEDWWVFGSQQGLTEGLAWTDVMTHSHTVQQSYIIDLIDTYCADSTWAPSSKVTTGVGSGDTRAAVGASSTCLLAYFPDNRTIVVDTTSLGTGSLVRLRWFDPTAGSYSTIAASEATNSSRSVTLPAARGDGTRDFVLVVDSPGVGLTVAGSSQTQSADAIALTQHNVLAVANSSQTQTADTLTLTQHNVLSMANGSQTQTAATTSLTQHNVLALAGSSQTQSADAIALSGAGSLSGLANSSQTQTADTLTLTWTPGGGGSPDANPEHVTIRTRSQVVISQ